MQTQPFDSSVGSAEDCSDMNRKVAGSIPARRSVLCCLGECTKCAALVVIDTCVNFLGSR